MILLVNGPNLNLLGEREPQIYGATTLPEIERMVEETCASYGRRLKAMQSNYEGAILDFLQEHRQEAKGLIINPGAFSHTSVAIHDCLRTLHCPAVEVHISNTQAREPFRRRSLIAPVCIGTITGFGPRSYELGLRALWHQLTSPAELP